MSVTIQKPVTISIGRSGEAITDFFQTSVSTSTAMTFEEVATGSDLDSQAGDEAALQDFYTAMDGPNWDNNTGWSADSIDLDQSMFGVFTKQVNGETRVDVLNLSGGNTQLNNPDIIGNNLTGNSIPNSFGNLKQMTDLRLKGNNITARIDNWIQSCTSLNVLSLSGSTGYGGQQELNLANRGYYNHPSKSDEAYNNWQGEIPDDLSMVPLYYFEASGSSFTGSLPTSLPDSIVGIFLQNNDLTGSFPAWANCVNMTHIYLENRYSSGGGNISGDIPSEWDNMTDMAWLELGWNDVHSIPEMPSWDDVRYFVIINGATTLGQYPEWITNDAAKNDQLHTFKVGPLSGSLPPTIECVSNWSGQISFNNGTLVGEIPGWVDRGAQQVNMQNNGFTSIASDLVVPARCKIFWINNNDISSPLPECEYDGVRNAHIQMWFQNNGFHGGIPASWSNLQNATNYIQIDLANNELDGLIPAYFADLEANGASLEYVDISNNRFTPKDIVPNKSAIDAITNYTVAPQKPFGTSSSVNQGNTIDLSEFAYTNNSYQWEYSADGGDTWSNVSGATSNTFDTTGQSLGLYRMLIDHPNMNYTFESVEFNVI